VGETAVSLTYVTGTLVKFGQGLGQTLCGRPGDWGWLLQAPMWLCLLAGGTAAAAARAYVGYAMWPLSCLAGVVALGILARGSR
jgi:uncharacterized membrane protein YoaK (UPF0700 family)